MIPFLKREWFLLLLLAATLVAAIVIYPHMPEQVPIHWNARGEVDGYGSRLFGTFFLPVLNLGMYALFLFLPRLDPKRANYEKFAGSYRFIRYTFHLFMAFMFALTAAAGLGRQVDIGLWVASGVAILFILLGNVLGRVRHNYFVGFRFPWTLANETVWKKTHQLGSKLMVAGGLLGLAGVLALDGDARFTALMVCIFLPMIVTIVYSYLVFRRIGS